MKIIDSSVYIASFLKNDPNNKKAIKIVEETNDTILLPYIVLSEVITVLTYKHSSALANATVDYILNDPRFTLIDGSIIEELYFWKNNQTKISFADIVIIFLAYKYNAKLITFNKQQEKEYIKNHIQ